MIYRLTVMGRSGEEARGGWAVDPEMAKKNPGQLRRHDRESELLGIETLDGEKPVLVTMEDFPGQWTVGVPSGGYYSPGTANAGEGGEQC